VTRTFEALEFVPARRARPAVVVVAARVMRNVALVVAIVEAMRALGLT
jgi:hypothetical protein